MTVRRYCDAAYTLIHREYQRLGSHLEEARDKLDGWDVAQPQAPSADDRADARADVEIARQNEQELRKLQTLLGGVG